MIYNRNVRIIVYAIILVLFSFLVGSSLIDTTPSEGQSMSYGLFGLGLFSLAYGRLWVKKVLSGAWRIRHEDAFKLARGMCFEVGAIFIAWAIVLIVRGYVS